MSDQPEFDLRAELARIDRDRAETQKFIAERDKLFREGEKFRAEEQKLWRDWRMAPWWFVISLAGALLGTIIARHL